MGTLHDQHQGRGKSQTFSLVKLLLIQCQSIKIHWRDSKGNLIKTVEGNEGDDLLSLAHEHDIDLEGAATCACILCTPLHKLSYQVLVKAPLHAQHVMSSSRRNIMTLFQNQKCVVTRHGPLLHFLTMLV